MRHTWVNRTAPVLVSVVVIGCAWYAASSQPKPVAVLPTQTADTTPIHSSASAQANSVPIADFAPTVSKSGTEVHFSLPDAKLPDVQKVEFYVEDTLVGAAFIAPYQVSVDEGNLTAGTHSVTAKVYTQNDTTQTTPALFTASPSTAHHTTDGGQADSDTDTSTDVGPASSAATLSAPVNLTATAGTDGASAILSWTASAGAGSYQIWRDGSPVGTASDITYTDVNLTAGQTYDYSVVAISGNQQSDPSAQVGFTLPSPPPTPPANSTKDTDQNAMTPGNSAGSPDDFENP